MTRRYMQLIFVISSFAFAAGFAATYEKQPDGVVFEIKKLNETGPQRMKIQVCSEDIIRVVAAPGEKFSTRPSLMAATTAWEQVPWTVNEADGAVIISTAKIAVHVNPVNGAVAFYNSEGRLLLQEKSQGGKIITPADVMGESTFHIQQLFDSPENEAFYGLGGHQNAIMNYKGRSLDLYQSNLSKVVPLLVSNRNYGILWDNNSRTKFGDIREFQSLSTLRLFGIDGAEGGLTAEYFTDSAFTSLLAARPEQKIEHEFSDVNDPFPDGFPARVKSVRWSGEIQSPLSGDFRFRLFCSGYTKMWLDGKLVVDSWRQNWLPWTHFPELAMDAGTRHSIKIEWIHSGGYIGLKWLGPEDPLYKNSLSLFSEVADQIDYYFIRGDNADQVIHGYREITGKAPMMPKWAMGFWQSREHYASQNELISVTNEFRKRGMPLDNMVQDWFYWKEDSWGSHEFDAARYPDPAGMIRTLHDSLHARLMISVWAKFYVGTNHYDQFNRQGWLYMRNVEKGQRDWVGPGYVSTFYDPYSAGARDLFWKQVNEKLYSKGIDAWWLDCTEPDIQSDLSREETILRQGPTALGSASRYLNTYSLMQTSAVYQGQRRANPDQRVFILTRSAFAGTQRYAAATWSGDIAARWYDLRAQISSGMNFCLSGIPYWTMDIGGFAVEPRYEHPNATDLEEWRELNTRWFEFGAFCPLFRVHGQFPYREMFNIAPENHPAYQAMLASDKLRYRLMPYVYSLTGMVTHDDYTIMRALMMDFGGDSKVLSIGDQFMFGPAFMVNPVTEYKARAREVYLPAAGWYDLRTGKYFPGGETVRADAPYESIPVFVREGSIVPCGPDVQYTSEKPADPIRLFVYAGRDGAFTLYEDENVNYNYGKGQFSRIPMRYDEKARALTIGKREGEFPGMLRTRSFEIIWISREKPSGLDFQSTPDAVVSYDGTSQTIGMGAGAK